MTNHLPEKVNANFLLTVFTSFTSFTSFISLSEPECWKACHAGKNERWQNTYTFPIDEMKHPSQILIWVLAFSGKKGNTVKVALSVEPLAKLKPPCERITDLVSCLVTQCKQVWLYYGHCFLSGIMKFTIQRIKGGTGVLSNQSKIIDSEATSNFNRCLHRYRIVKHK
jgi:hypothetical protein